jgi:hypothetical protein
VFERCGVGDMQDLLGAANIDAKIQIMEAVEVAKATLPSLNKCTFADVYSLLERLQCDISLIDFPPRTIISCLRIAQQPRSLCSLGMKTKT